MADTLTKLNGLSYNYKYRLYNDAGDEFIINDSSVLTLYYRENLFDPWADGSITIANPSNYIEKEFIFRGDGSDKIDIFLQLKDAGSTVTAANYEIKNTFVIIGEDNNIDDATPVKNSKTFVFIDEHESQLLHRFPYGKAYDGKAGDIISNILDESKINAKKGQIEPGDFKLTKEDPFVPSLNYRYIDVIFYLLQHYYFKDGDIPVKGFLTKSRKGIYELKPLSKGFFDRNAKLLIEAFHAGDILMRGEIGWGSDDNPATPKGTPYNSATGNATSIALDSYNVDDSNQYFMNTNVMSYDDVLGTVCIDQLRIKEVRQEWEDKFVKQFPMKYGSPKKHLPMTKEKLEGQFKTCRLPYTREQNLNIVKANMISDFIFRNNQIMITTNGDLARQPGTFIDVSLEKNGAKSPLLLGRWFVTGVDHVKIGSTYRNTIKAVKTFAGPTYQEKDV